MKHSRKTFLQLLGAGAIASGASIFPVNSAKAAKPDHALTLGLASYSLRNYSLDQTIDIAARLGLTHLALKSMHMPLSSTAEELGYFARKVRDKGITLYGAGVIYMKNENEVNNAFQYGKEAGLEVIIGVPNHDLLPLVNEKVKETGIKLAIHNHGPGDDVYPSPESVYEKVKNLDPRIGLCIDIGHTIRIGLDPATEIKRFADRLYDMHFKDVDKAQPEGATVEIGRGVIDIPGIVKTLKKIKYSGVVALEYENDADDAIPGLAESVGYVRGILAK